MNALRDSLARIQFAVESSSIVAFRTMAIATLDQTAAAIAPIVGLSIATFDHFVARGCFSRVDCTSAWAILFVFATRTIGYPIADLRSKQAHFAVAITKSFMIPRAGLAIAVLKNKG